MPRELHPENLRAPWSPEEAREQGRKGGKASGQARRDRKTFGMLLAERMGEDDYREIVDNLIKRAKKHDKAFETLRDTMGEMPVKPVQVEQVEPFRIEIETLTGGTGSGDGSEGPAGEV